MRHGNKINKLSRTASHRRALLSNMATALITNKRIFTTLAKAKALRSYVEPLLTKCKTDTMTNRRVVFSYLQDKEAIKELFGTISNKIANRPGGYTRVLHAGNRSGDNAEIAMIELVDFNDIYTKPSKAAEAPAKKTRRGKTKTAKTAEELSAEASEGTTAKAKAPKKTAKAKVAKAEDTIVNDTEDTTDEDNSK
jgi:large subunit ribosomal protein L17